MSKLFDMELSLNGVLTGSNTTRQRHIQQAKAIQTAIANRWHLDNPWTWQRKHLMWFLNARIIDRSEVTKYYYLRTIHFSPPPTEKILDLLILVGSGRESE